MDSESLQGDKMLWDWFDWLWCKEKQGLQPHFREEVLAFLTQPIFFRDRKGQQIYVIVSHIEDVRADPDKQIAFDFQISTTPPPNRHKPIIGEMEEAKPILSSLQFGESSSARTVYGYTFTNLNTFDQNRKNLQDFVLNQWEEENEFDPLLDD